MYMYMYIVQVKQITLRDGVILLHTPEYLYLLSSPLPPPGVSPVFTPYPRSIVESKGTFSLYSDLRSSSATISR